MIVTEGVIACMATIPARRSKLKKVVMSLIDQVDKVFIYMNGHKSAPAWMKDHEKIGYVLSENSPEGDMGDAGKFYWAEVHQGIYLTVDDDLIYPPDYVAQMLEGLDSVKNRAVITMHGALINRGAREYHAGKKLYPLLSVQHKTRHVHIGGTGCMAFDTELIRPLATWFKKPNMADVWIGAACQRFKIPIVMIPHDGASFELIRWKKTIYEATSSKDGSEMDASETINEIIRNTDWRLPPIVGR